jgi:hypothetical protein
MTSTRCWDRSTPRAFRSAGSVAALAFGALLAAGCASSESTVSTAHWEKPGGTQADFVSDNDRCGAVASRQTPTARADSVPASAVAPRNRMDSPPRIDANPTYHNAYMGCMADRGWRVVPR